MLRLLMPYLRQVGALFQLHNLESLSLSANMVLVLPGTIAPWQEAQDRRLIHPADRLGHGQLGVFGMGSVYVRIRMRRKLRLLMPPPPWQVGALFQLHSLESLSLSANMVAVLPGTIARFTGLTSLDMYTPPHAGIWALRAPKEARLLGVQSRFT